MKHHPFTLAGIVLITAGTLAATDAMATPAFSRQINADCKTCHFQSMHALNKFGRQFKANAFHESEKMRSERMRRAHRQNKDKPHEPDPATKGP